jgi:hypothetical protein
MSLPVVRFEYPRSLAKGRPLSTAHVGYPADQLGSRLSGGEIAHPAVAGCPSVAASVATPIPAVQRLVPLFPFNLLNYALGLPPNPP